MEDDSDNSVLNFLQNDKMKRTTTCLYGLVNKIKNNKTNKKNEMTE